MQSMPLHATTHAQHNRYAEDAPEPSMMDALKLADEIGRFVDRSSRLGARGPVTTS
jgi:hypothetical protein